VPSFHRKFSILPIRHGLPPRSKHFVEGGLKQVMVDRGCRDTINPRTKRLVGHESIRRVPGRYVDLDRLCCTHGQQGKAFNQQYENRHPILQDLLLKSF
jgi:hypothetical protein